MNIDSLGNAIKRRALAVLPLLLLAGCGAHEPMHEGELVFKGKVAHVQFRLGQGYTLLIDSEGKVTRLEGYPGVPCVEVEIFKRGEREYEVFQSAPQS